MSHIHWVVPFLLSYILRDVSFSEVDSVCRVALREPMHLCTYVSEEGGDGEAARSETPSLLSYTLRYVSFAEVGIICRVALREPMHLCTCVSEEGGDGEDAFSETPSLLSYTRRYVSFAEVDSGEAACSETPSLLSYILRYVSFAEVGCRRQRLPGCVTRTDAPVYMRERGGWGQGGSGGGWGHIKCTIVNRSCRICRVCNFCEHERGSEGRRSTKNDTEKYKCQLHHSISKTVTLFALLLRASGQLPCYLAPIETKNVRSTILCYRLHKETILHPVPQCITVRYRKGIRLS
jgi:hypothetical protein